MHLYCRVKAAPKYTSDCAYSKISTLPSLSHVYHCWKGGLIFGRIQYMYACVNMHEELVITAWLSARQLSLHHISLYSICLYVCMSCFNKFLYVMCTAALLLLNVSRPLYMNTMDLATYGSPWKKAMIWWIIISSTQLQACIQPWLLLLTK